MSQSVAKAGYNTIIKLGDGGVGAGTQASRTIGTSNQQVIIKAKKAGTAGNSKTCSIAVSGNNTAFALTVTESAITIVSATDDSAAATTTVNELLYQLMQNDTFTEHWEATRGAGNGTGVIVAAASAALSGGAAGTEVFTAIAEVKDIQGPGRNRNIIEVTHLTSPDGEREYIGGLRDGGQVTFPMNFINDDTQQDLLATLEEDDPVNFQIVFPTEEGDVTIQFAGLVTQWDYGFPREDAIMANVTIKVSGPIEEV